MTFSTRPVREQIGVTVTRLAQEPWLATYARAAAELVSIARRRGAAGLVALSPAWIVGDVLRVTAHLGGE